MADPSIILSAAPKTDNNPLAIVSQYQDLANKITANKLQQQTLANAQLANQTGQQSLATTMANRHAQIIASLANRPDSELAGGGPLYAALQDEVASGQLDPKRAAVFKSQIDAVTANGGAQNGAAYRPLLVSSLMSTLPGTAAMAAMTPGQRQVDVGGQIVSQVTPSQMGMITNPLAGPTNLAQGSLNKTLPPTIINTQNAQYVAGGAYPTAQVYQNGTSPGEANAIQTMIDPVTGQTVVGRNGSFGGMVQGGPVGASPGAVPGAIGGPASIGGGGPNGGLPVAPQGGFRLPGANGAAAAPQAPGAVGGQAPGGMLGNGPVAINQQALDAQKQNYTDFRSNWEALPDLKTNEQTLTRVAGELQRAVTGPVADKVQALRNVVSSVNGLTGGKIKEVDLQAADYDELSKDLNQLVSQAPKNSGLAGALEAVVHGNPNMMLNRLANSNVVTIMTGLNRQKQLALAMTKDQTSGRDWKQARDAANDLDPRALGLDVMPPVMRQQVLQELQHDPAAYKKFFKSIAIAKQYGFLTGSQAAQ